jgi:hypothetical protein
MDPVTIALIGGGLMSAYNQQQGANAASAAAKKQMDILNSVPLPVLKEFYPELYKQVVELNPEMLAAQSLGPSAMESVQVSPELKQAQMNALLKLQGIGETGMTAGDQARLAEIESGINRNLKGQTGAIQQNLAARGLSGGMTELVSRQLASQEAANRQAQLGLDVKAQAEQRALDAIMQSGQLGGQMGQQQFQNAAQIAQAKDLINKFNAQNLQQVSQTNVEARNAAQLANAQAKQNIAGQNVGLSNEAQKYNLGLAQQNYQNQMARATGQTQALADQAKVDAANRAAQNQMIGGLIQTGAMYYGGAYSPQNKTKLPGEA